MVNVPQFITVPTYIALWVSAVSKNLFVTFICENYSEELTKKHYEFIK